MFSYFEAVLDYFGYFIACLGLPGGSCLTKTCLQQPMPMALAKASSACCRLSDTRVKSHNYCLRKYSDARSNKMPMLMAAVMLIVICIHQPPKSLDQAGQMYIELGMSYTGLVRQVLPDQGESGDAIHSNADQLFKKR